MPTIRDIWVYLEQEEGQLLEVSLEMLGEARRLIDDLNKRHNQDEKVVGVVLGHNVGTLCKEAIYHGVDVVYFADDPELEHFRLEPYTKIIGDIVRQRNEYKDYDKPRYFLFPATNNGRDISATVLAELESGLASDCNELYVVDGIKYKRPSEREIRTYGKVLAMKRPDFTGFEWSTIVCLGYSPEACSIIPGSFKPLSRDEARKGKIIEHKASLDEKYYRVKIQTREKLDTGIDLSKAKVIVSFGRGIRENPELGIKLSKELAQMLNGDVGVSRGAALAPYNVEPSVKAQYLTEARQIGETGQTVAPKLYLAIGISGAIQHKKGMDKSEIIISINTDPHAPISQYSDYLLKGDLFHGVPKLLEMIKKQKENVAS